jgi:hypothetical protein
LGEVLEGDRLVTTPYKLKFKVDVENEVLCAKQLGAKELKVLRKAVAKDYYFQARHNPSSCCRSCCLLCALAQLLWCSQSYFDDLPVWGFIGKIQKIVKTGAISHYMFTHFHFEIAYNDDRVVEINISSDPLKTVDISQNTPLNVQFSYSVKWEPTTTTFEHRMDRYAKNSFLPQHWEVRAAVHTTPDPALPPLYGRHPRRLEHGSMPLQPLRCTSRPPPYRRQSPPGASNPPS